jgi:hypothetical protein
MMTLAEMALYIERHNFSNIIRLCDVKRSAGNIKNEELCFIDELLDNKVLTSILASKGYSPQMRDYYPIQFFRAELWFIGIERTFEKILLKKVDMSFP